ncbi:MULTISPECIES: GUN4 domain-containing protein [Pseudanabaena]|uniref:GUN4 domain-containing protein n=1 Tax=Pseudanabaena TaxID=1152 RepID=UPI0024793C52|nr:MULTISPECIES: GUN4 domain-containing protein [Pseudanabaena]MEA5489071.1 GUN4 domain-containing protein [Pseudanabaena sp. CCNP1317]WGS73091.1 GUN4 domain-containing protein [Pseudanabaena galeata CCNP1313]
MTQEPEKHSNSSPEKRFVQRSLAAIARWSPLGGTSVAFGGFLLKQEWATALMLFPVTAVSGVWAAYSKHFIERLSEIYAERGKKDAEGFVENIDQANQFLTKKLNWQALGFDAKYLKCQMWDCYEDYAVGVRENENLPVNNPLLREVFVPLELSSDSIVAGQKFRDRGEDCPQMQIWELLERVKQDNRLRQIAIRAWGGYGKSTLLKHLTYIYSTGEYNKGDFRRYKVPKFVPFLLYLSGCWKEITKENPPDLLELLTTFHIGRLSKIKELETVPPNWALNLLRKGDALVMFDGFDEVPPAERTKVSEWLSGEMQKYHEAVFIVTSRPTAYREDYVARKPTASFWIQDFNQEQRKQFVEQWYFCQERYARGGRSTPDVEAKAKERAESLLEQIQSRPELNDIAGNVLLLNMMARFHRENKQGAELPQRKVELYQDICELQLGRRASARGIPLLFKSINQRQEVLQVVALAMMMEAAKSIDDGEEEGFKQIKVDQLLKLLNESLVKIDPDVDAKEFLGQMVQVSELLVERDGGIYQFSHLSFQEFLAAMEVLKLQQESLLYEHLGLSAWKDMILFYASLVNPTKLIQKALNRHQVDLAYLIYQQSDKRLNLSSSERKALDGLKEYVKTSRYQQLEDYLTAKQWYEADQETYRLMITAVGKDVGQRFSTKDIKEFPCDELLAIDNLWGKLSNGLYGFSVQKQIYVECGGKLDFSNPSSKTWDKFCDQTAWKKDGKYVLYPEPFFENNFMYVKGHLPYLGLELSRNGWECRSIFSRIETCEV